VRHAHRQILHEANPKQIRRRDRTDHDHRCRCGAGLPLRAPRLDHTPSRLLSAPHTATRDTPMPHAARAGACRIATLRDHTPSRLPTAPHTATRDTPVPHAARVVACRIAPRLDRAPHASSPRLTQLPAMRRRMPYRHTPRSHDPSRPPMRIPGGHTLRATPSRRRACPRELWRHRAVRAVAELRRQVRMHGHLRGLQGHSRPPQSMSPRTVAIGPFARSPS
jgi:hypothetical protein